ncbi:MAG: AAA family ATPase [Saprospiraceae bacterium]
MNINKLEEKVIQYFTDELGYPKESILKEISISHGHGTSGRFDLGIYLFGKLKLIIDIKDTSNKNLKFLLEKDASMNEFGIHYYMITNGENYLCFNTFTNKKEKVPSYEELTNKIYLEHEEIFNFLEEKRQAGEITTYKLRSTNNNNRLSNGYWFLGNDNYIAVSFWSGNDWKNRTPNIYLAFLPSGKVSLIFSSRDSSIKADFFDELASIIVGFKQGKSQGKSIAYWEKNLSLAPNQFVLSTNRPFLETLEKFIKTDKKIIDTFISHEIDLKKKGLDGIGFINPADFDKNLQKILNYRKNLEVLKQNKGRDDEDIQTKHSETTPLVLQKLQLQNIGHFRSLNLDLNHRIICLLGENGIGKSTILRAILLGLIGVDETSEIDVERKTLQQLLRITGHSKGAPIFVSNGYIQVKYDYGKSYTNRINFEKITDEIDVRIYDAIETNEDSFGATNGNYLNNLVIGFSQVQSRESKEADNNLILIKKAHVKDILPLLYDEADNRFQQLSEWIIRLYAESLTNVEKEGERKIIDFVFEVVGEIIGEAVVFEKVNHLDNLLWVRVNSNDAVPFHLISQGFKNVFAWVGHFMKRLAEANDYAPGFMNKPALLLIDEIDTYLHPKWQKNILRVLAEKFPNTQIIVTTHSPLVASHLPTESKAVYIIKEDKVIPIKHIYGKEIASIFYQWMGVKERPKAIQDKIDLLFVELDKENMESAKQLYDELKINLGEDDEVLVEAKTYMQLVEN